MSTQATEQKTIQQFIRENHITMTCEWADSNPNMAGDDKWQATHYKVKLSIIGYLPELKVRSGKRTLSTYFSMGMAHTKEPGADDVLSCLASDTAGFENARSFEDWCGDYGYDTDSRKAEKTWKAIEKSAEQLKRFLGSDELYQELLFNVEPL